MDSLHAFKRFALTVDMISGTLRSEINDILTHIATNILGASYYAVQEIGSLNKTTGTIENLRTLWSMIHKIEMTPILQEGKYSCQAAYAYDKDLKLWVTAINGGFLEEEEEYIDQWSGAERLPKYWDDDPNHENKTSVLLPLRIEGTPFSLGVVNFEFEAFINCTNQYKTILNDFANSIAVIVHKVKMRRYQNSVSKEVAKEIKSLSYSRKKILSIPKIFVAFPLKRETDVTDVLEELEAQLPDYDFIWWNKMPNAGNIDKHLIKVINQSKYGIVYFSELTDKKGIYNDNSNVVFEAGMFHALSNELTSSPKTWIPIREKVSGKIPFDFAHERIIEINRKKDGTLNKADLISQLKNRLKFLNIL